MGEQLMDDCPHDLAERETACADGLCPICLARQIADERQQHERSCALMVGQVTRAERAEAERDALRKALCSIIEYHEREVRPYNGNAPGHAHRRRGIWDNDNALGVRGTKCEWCALWSAARELAAQSPPPSAAAAVEQEDAQRGGL